MIIVFITDKMSSSSSSKSNVKIAPGAVVCNECEMKGDITIGPRTVVHPKARIIAEAGPIIIGNILDFPCHSWSLSGVYFESAAEPNVMFSSNIGNTQGESYYVFKACYCSGEGNLIEEQSEIINRIETEGETGTVPVMIIGNSNVFEVNKAVMTEATEIAFQRKKIIKGKQ